MRESPHPTPLREVSGMSISNKLKIFGLALAALGAALYVVVVWYRLSQHDLDVFREVDLIAMILLMGGTTIVVRQVILGWKISGSPRSATSVWLAIAGGWLCVLILAVLALT